VRPGDKVTVSDTTDGIRALVEEDRPIFLTYGWLTLNGDSAPVPKSDPPAWYQMNEGGEHSVVAAAVAAATEPPQ